MDKNDRKYYRKHWNCKDPALFEWIAHQRGFSYDPTLELERKLDGEPDPIKEEWDRSDLLRKCIKKLSKDEQTVVFHYYYDGWTLQQIADKMGVVVSTAFKKRERALKKLRYLIERAQK